MSILLNNAIQYSYGEGDDVQVPKTIRGILKRVNGKHQDVELSEELTNAYFGNREAWQLPPTDTHTQSETNKEP